MYHLAKLTCAFVALSTFATSARADAPGNDLLATFVGTWKATGSASGTDVDGMLVVKWGESKACVVTEYRLKRGGDSLAGNHVVGFDSARKSFRVLGFFSDGTVEDYYYRKRSKGVYEGEYAGTKDGQKLKGDLTVTVAENSVKFETSGLKLGGKPTAELAVTLTRVKDAGPADNYYLTFWRSYFQGDWTVRILTGDSAGRIAIGTEGTWSCQLAPTKACMLFSTTTNGNPDSNTIAGFDRAANAWKEVSFMADGGHLTQFYYAKPADLLGDPAGKVIKGKAKYVRVDETIENADIAVSILDRDNCEYVVSNRRIGKEKLPDLTAHFKRKK